MDYRIIDFIVVEIFAYDISYRYTLKYFDTAKVPKRKTKKRFFCAHISTSVYNKRGDKRPTLFTCFIHSVLTCGKKCRQSDVKFHWILLH